MPVEFGELAKLIGGIILLIIPGYLWSFILFSKITRLERIVFGFVLTISMFVLAMFTIDIILDLPLTYTKTWVLYGVYTGIVLILYFISLFKIGLSTQTKQLFTKFKEFFKQPIKTITSNKNFQILLLLTGIIIFAGFMGLLPHIKDNYYLPFHVDEWLHWTYSKSFMEAGSSFFINPYLGTVTTQSLEPGFNYIIATFAWLTGTDFNTMFVFMPAIITMFASLAAFILGNRHKRAFGLEAALCVAVIPTTCRMLGPSFFVPVAMGLFLLVFLLWYLQQEKQFPLLLFMPVGIWVIFLIHPPTALAAIIITFIYAIMLIFDKKFKQSAILAVFAIIPVGAAFLLTAGWKGIRQQFVDAFFGGKYSLDYNLPQIWVSFEQMGLIIWILAIIGAYFSFIKGKTIIRAIGLSALTFIILIGLYDKLGYGLPIVYERSFMYLFLMICLLAGWGLSEFRRSITELTLEYLPIKKGKIKCTNSVKYTSFFISVVAFILLATTTLPVHNDIPYYHMINELDYESFTWINENIDNYRNSTHPYNRAAVDPFKASPFSAITRLYIVSSTMHPIPGYKHHKEVSAFLNNGCVDTSFLEDFDVSIVYNNKCNTQDLTMIYPQVYIFSGT